MHTVTWTRDPELVVLAISRIIYSDLLRRLRPDLYINGTEPLRQVREIEVTASIEDLQTLDRHLGEFWHAEVLVAHAPLVIA